MRPCRHRRPAGGARATAESRLPLAVSPSASERRSKLTSDREAEILRATLDLVEEVGYQDLSGDLITLTSHLTEIAGTEIVLMAVLAHASMREQCPAELMRAELSIPAESQLDLIIDRAAARGEIEADPRHPSL